MRSSYTRPSARLIRLAATLYAPPTPHPPILARKPKQNSRQLDLADKPVERKDNSQNQ